MTTDNWTPSNRKRMPPRKKPIVLPMPPAMTDIVEWLRKEAELIALPRLSEAAAEIERLRKAVNEQAALIELMTRNRPP